MNQGNHGLARRRRRRKKQPSAGKHLQAAGFWFPMVLLPSAYVRVVGVSRRRIPTSGIE